MNKHIRHHIIGTALTCCLSLAHGQTTPDTAHSTTEASAPPTTVGATPWTMSGGLGLFHYTEPGVMRLTGPEASLQLRYKTQTPYWPEVLQADVGAALLDYNSDTTGYMNKLPALTGRGTALWRLWTNEGAAWRAGLQVDMVWTDLRGRSTSGHLGYRRLGSKAWAVLQHESIDGARIEIGGLLQGQQDTWLTDARQAQDIRNKQRSGVYLAYQHPPLTQLWPGLRPWIRYSQVGRSDIDWNHYEPYNKTLQIGALIDW